MAELQDLTEATSLADDTWLYLFDPVGSPKDRKIKSQNVKRTNVDETLTNKTLNTPATAKPAYVTTLQLPGAKLTTLIRGSGSLAPGVLAADAEATPTVTITGLAVGDHVILNPTSALEANVVIAGYWISAADTLSVRVRNCNPGGATAGTAIPVSWLVIRAVAADV